MAGFLLGESWHVVEQYVDVLQYIVIGVVALGVTWFVFARTRALVAAARGRTDNETATLAAELEALESELDERAEASRD